MDDARPFVTDAIVVFVVCIESLRVHRYIASVDRRAKGDYAHIINWPVGGASIPA